MVCSRFSAWSKTIFLRAPSRRSSRPRVGPREVLFKHRPLTPPRSAQPYPLAAGPRWIGVLGFAVGAVLLVSVGLTPWVELLFPAWILLLSIDIMRTGLRSPAARAAPPSTHRHDRASRRLPATSGGVSLARPRWRSRPTGDAGPDWRAAMRTALSAVIRAEPSACQARRPCHPNQQICARTMAQLTVLTEFILGVRRCSDPLASRCSTGLRCLSRHQHVADRDRVSSHQM